MEGNRTDGTKNKAGEKPNPSRTSADCRCKETSKMSPRELLKLMMKDLAFWKKAGK